jgi:hypothetical protein
MNLVHSLQLLMMGLVFAASACAGPPLLCDPFDTAGATTLDWGKRGWNDALPGYDLDQLWQRTEALLAPKTPVIARMETLRRAAIYASRRGRIVRRLDAALEARIAAASDEGAKALALFDAGYFRETLQEIVRLQSYDMPGVGRVDVEALRALHRRGDGSERIARALALRPGDASMHFAAALVAVADERADVHARHVAEALAGANADRVLLLNIDRIKQ